MNFVIIYGQITTNPLNCELNAQIIVISNVMALHISFVSTNDALDDIRTRNE